MKNKIPPEELISHQHLTDVAYMVHLEAKPCWLGEYYAEPGTWSLKDLKAQCRAAKKTYPDVKVFCNVQTVEMSGLVYDQVYLLFYKHEFQKDIFVWRFLGGPSTSVVGWAIAGMLFGYPHRNIQERWNKNKKLKA